MHEENKYYVLIGPNTRGWITDLITGADIYGKLIAKAAAGNLKYNNLEQEINFDLAIK